MAAIGENKNMDENSRRILGISLEPRFHRHCLSIVFYCLWSDSGAVCSMLLPVQTRARPLDKDRILLWFIIFNLFNTVEPFPTYSSVQMVFLK